MASKKISVSDLGFDGIKQNLKEYLKGQETFSDYNFEGGALSVLLDVLAYNTHYNALHTNLAINESFLDSATKRSSVVSKAREMGYTPASAKCAQAIVDATLTTQTAITGFSLPKYTPFVALVGTTQYTFYTTALTQFKLEASTSATTKGLVLKQGIPTHQVYEYTTGMKIIISNSNVDLDTLSVIVQPNGQTSASTTFVEASTILDLDDTSTIYTVKELENQQYELVFGDGIIGVPLETGNVISLTYFITSGAAANDVRRFTYAGPSLPGSGVLYTETVQAAQFGDDAETIESIKWNAPRAFISQNRCVTLDDYKTLIYRMYSNAESVNVWGGESNNPPSYGDVFISIRPKTSYKLSDSEKNYIQEYILGPRKVATMHPKFVDPTYINVEINTTFYYDAAKTTHTSADLSKYVTDSITGYASDNLNQFGSILRYSKLTEAIDNSENSITNSITTIKLHREVTPNYNNNVTYTVNLGNPIYNSGVPEDSVLSTGIYVLNVAPIVYICDLPTLGTDTGILQLFYYSNNKRIVVRKIGKIIYSQGLLTFDNTVIVGLAEESFKFVIKPQSNDVVGVRNDVIDIPSSLIKVTALPNKPAKQYTFASSRN